MSGAATAYRMDDNIRRQLLAASWEAIGVQLTAYAIHKARNLQWRTGRADLLAAGFSPEDVAAEAVRRVLDGTRSWDPQRGDLLSYLRAVVDSLMGHLVTSFDNRMLERLPDTIDNPNLGQARAATACNRADTVSVTGRDDRIEQLYTLLETNRQEELLAVLNAIVDCGDEKPQAVAAHLRVSVTEIYNRLKRLRRLAHGIVSRGRSAG